MAQGLGVIKKGGIVVRCPRERLPKTLGVGCRHFYFLQIGEE